MNAHNPVAVNDPWSWIWRLGYRSIVPIRPNDKRPGVKVDGEWVDLRGWTTLHPSESDIDRYRNMGAGIGIRCENGHLAIDADTLSEEWSARIEEEITAALGDLPQRIGQAPKRLFFCRTEPGYAHGAIRFDEGVVEVRTSGQFVAAGIHPKTGSAYRWTRALPPAEDLPHVNPDALNRLWQRLREILPGAYFSGGAGPDTPRPPEELRGTEEGVKRTVASIPNDYRDRADYFRILSAIAGSLPDDPDAGWEIAWAWCERWTSGVNDEDVVRKDFESCYAQPRKIGIGYLEDLANRRTGNLLLAEKHSESVEAEPDAGESIFPKEEPTSALDLRGTPYGFAPAASLAPRQFLYGTHYLRQYVSVTVAPTKVGKTSLAVVEALAMASGKPLLGIKPTGLWRVRLWNGEDPAEELDRRIAAAMFEYGLTREDIGDRLLRDSGRDMPICMAVMAKDGARIQRPVVEALERAIEAQRIDVLGIDPFVKSHSVSENDNVAIDAAAREWNLIAGRRRIAIDLTHHSRKMNGGEASIDDARGASALVSAARSARVLARMTKKEGERAGRSKDYRRFFRFADASSNMAAPAREDETWMELKSVDLHNGVFDDSGNLLWPSDQVGVVRLSGVQGALDDEAPTEAHAEAESAALAELASGEWRQDSQSRDAWAGVPVARAYGLSLDDFDDKARAKTLLKGWLKSGKLVAESRKDDKRRLRTFVRTALQSVITPPEDDLFG